MELKKFVEDFSSQLEEKEISTIAPETKFKDLEEWSSLMVLSIIAMIDDEYNVKIKGDDIRMSSTISDLYEVVKSRK